jgi:hypothetical protein
MPAVVTVTPPRTVRTAALERRALRLAAQTGSDHVLVVRRLTPPALTETELVFSGEGPPAGLTPPYEAYRLYRDGRREPVRNLGFRGVDRRSLREIVLAGNGAGPTDLLDGNAGTGRFYIGATGGMPVTWDVPSVLIAELEVGGRSGGEARVLEVPRTAVSPGAEATPGP